MADFTLKTQLPEGTSIGAYLKSNWPTPELPSGAPIGEADDTQEVESSAVEFEGLDSEAEYWAVAEVGGSYRYTSFIAAANFTDAEALAFDPDEEPPGKIIRGTGPRSVVPMADRDEWWAGDFGMKFNGDVETDDFETAVEESRAGGKKLHLPAGVTALDATLAPTGADAPWVQGQGKGKTIIEHGAHNLPLWTPAGGSLAAATTIAAPVAVGDREITVASVSGLAVGQLIFLRSIGEPIAGGEGESEEVEGGSKNTTSALGGDIVRIRGINSGEKKLILGGITQWAYAVESDVRVLEEPMDGALFADFTIRNELESNSSAAARGVLATRCTNLRFVNLGFERMDGAGLYTTYSYGVFIDNPEFLDMREGVTNGYGIVAGRATANGRVRGLTSRGGRHAFTTTADKSEIAPQHWAVLGAMVAESGLTALDTHPGSRFFSFIDCVVHHSPYNETNGRAFQLRGPDQKVINAVVNGAEQGVGFVDGADRGLVHGGVFRNCNIGLRINDSDKATVTGGCRIERPREYGILRQAASAAWEGHMTQQNIDDCVITGEPSQFAIAQEFENPKDVTVDLLRVKIPDAPRSKHFNKYVKRFRSTRPDEQQRAMALAIPGRILVSESFERGDDVSDTITAPASKSEVVFLHYFRKGDPVKYGRIYAGSTALSGGTHQYMTIRSFAAKPVLLVKSKDKTSTAWAAGGGQEFEFEEEWICPEDGLYYIGLLIVAATVPNLTGENTVAKQNAKAVKRTGIINTEVESPQAEGGELVERGGWPHISFWIDE